MEARALMATLADLQAEREALRAAQAKADFDAAQAETCAQADLMAAADAVRTVLLDALDGLAVICLPSRAGPICTERSTSAPTCRGRG